MLRNEDRSQACTHSSLGSNAMVRFALSRKEVFSIFIHSYSGREGIGFKLRACVGCSDHSSGHIEITLENSL